MTHPEKPVPRDQLEAVERLIQIVDTLRSPGGCPWDAKQTVESLTPHLLEECHELADAVARRDDPGTREELGDLLMGVLMVSRVAAEDRGYGLPEVAGGISDKLIRRHPHVYGEVVVADEGEVLSNWEAIKKLEKQDAGQDDTSALSGVPSSLPALLRAYRVGQKAANTGFDWPDLLGPAEKVDEEWAELQDAIARDDRQEAEHEIGDLLFAIVNMARKLEIEPELALRGTIERFSSRFRHIERNLGKPFGEATLEEMDALWDQAKEAESCSPQA
ncbi:MAG: nucleoside triphosphate pyrophosphohydrolase [Planctomycetes bacterium]|nr:nucleoside triphosphate pyrophosphohydrolase [Planctomycetota bacterium]MBL7008000.1 nucleoside triphosphate pyrophosphohydrolase [Planctomycetota bacterium]